MSRLGVGGVVGVVNAISTFVLAGVLFGHRPSSWDIRE